ncbi:MAG: TonB-dependent receptor, partial [Proteobacteria bacterium]
LALSYALQAAVDLDGALDSARRAAAIDPDNGYAWTRVAELESSAGYFRDALVSAEKAVEKSLALTRSDSARAYTILGFVRLTRMETGAALDAFREAQDAVRGSAGSAQADPLLPLGIGLALIRLNRLEEGRARIEEAVSLDPNNALLRSYLGKAYYEEKRNRLAAETFDLAKTSDRGDPTAWSYDAALDQTRNQPLDALSNLNESIRLNDNRLSFRSRLQLDQDLAARGTGLARTYRDLGFDRLGYLEGWRALDSDPGSFSARRFLADIFAEMPRHEIARQSELLQSQLRQPLTIHPVQPRIGESGSFIQPGTGPRDAALNEHTPLFVRERPVVQVNGIVGENGTRGDEILVSGIDGKGSYSLGQFHFETDGMRANADQDQDSLVAFGQWAATPGTNIQFDARTTEIERGDLVMRIDPDNFFPTLREDLNEDVMRLGFRHEFEPGSDLIGSWWHQEFDTSLAFGGGSEAAAELEGDQVELQKLNRFGRSTLQTGVSYFSGDRTDSDVFMGMTNTSMESETDYGAYGYWNFNPSGNLSVTLGLSAQSTEGGLKDDDQVSPKFAIAYRLPNHGQTTVRLAGFRTLQRTIASDQTLERTTIAGFNQFFDDAEGTEATRYGLGIDHAAANERWFGGFELSRRDLTVPGQVLTPMGPLVQEGDLEETLGLAYLYWIPERQGERWSWSFTGELTREEFERPDGFTGPEEILDLVTETLTLGANLFHDSGLGVRIAASRVDQDGTFGVGPPFGAYSEDGERLWVVDVDLDYRLPRRRGVITLGVRNLFDEEFRYQDTDLESPRFASGQYLFARIFLAF